MGGCCKIITKDSINEDIEINSDDISKEMEIMNEMSTSIKNTFKNTNNKNNNKTTKELKNINKNSEITIKNNPEFNFNEKYKERFNMSIRENDINKKEGKELIYSQSKEFSDKSSIITIKNKGSSNVIEESNIEKKIDDILNENEKIQKPQKLNSELNLNKNDLKQDSIILEEKKNEEELKNIMRESKIEQKEKLL